MILIGIDPGLRTGISVVQVTETSIEQVFSTTVDYTDPKEFSVGRQVKKIIRGNLMYNGVEVLDSDIRFVVEKFVPEARKVDTTALEVIGELRQAIRDQDGWATDGMRKWYWQTRQEKDSVHNDVLRRLGLWVKGHDNRHINDASKHVVRRLVAMKHDFTLETGWPQ